MDLYKNFVNFAHKNKCYWYRQALWESKQSKEHYLIWEYHLSCGGLNETCKDFELEQLSDLELEVIKDYKHEALKLP